MRDGPHRHRVRDVRRPAWLRRRSAAVIGLQMVPILEPLSLLDLAVPYARDLGIAFQLANFIRDVGEDLDRGRLYLPLDDLAAPRPHPSRPRRGRRRPRAALRVRVARSRGSTRPRHRGSVCSTPPAARASRRRHARTAASSTRSSGVDYQVSTGASRCPLARRLAVAARPGSRGALPAGGSRLERSTRTRPVARSGCTTSRWRP